MGNILTTKIPGVLDLTRDTFADDRGFFREVFHLDELNNALGFEFKPVQMNHSQSKPGVIRALHAEHWNKLIYPVSGEMFAALVDIRPASPFFKSVATFTFDDQHRHALFIPDGVANSICACGNSPVEYLYLVDSYYTGSDTTAIAWDDPDLAISWPVKNPILSRRDLHNPGLRELFPDKF
jgi:dTDP-4-dehydrorhamnose 3,5-epimerase